MIFSLISFSLCMSHLYLLFSFLITSWMIFDSHWFSSYGFLCSSFSFCSSLFSVIIFLSLTQAFHFSVVSWFNGDGTGLTQPETNCFGVIFSASPQPQFGYIFLFPSFATFANINTIIYIFRFARSFIILIESSKKIDQEYDKTVPLLWCILFL